MGLVNMLIVCVCVLVQIVGRSVPQISGPNSSPLGQNGRHFADDIFKYNFINNKFLYFDRIPLKFVPKGPIDSKSVLVQIMAWLDFKRTTQNPYN